MSVQLDLFEWSETRPTSVIDANDKFDRRAVELVLALDAGRKVRSAGKIIYLNAHRQRLSDRAAVVGASSGFPPAPAEGFR